MDLASQIRTTITSQPPRMLLYGTPGIGKSSWAAHTPHPIIIQTEDGLTGLRGQGLEDTPHFDVASSMEEVFTNMGLLIKEDHAYKTVIVDSVDWLESFIWAAVVKAHASNAINSIADIGYGKGYAAAMLHWLRFLDGLKMLREKGMAIILIAHSEIKQFDPPDADSYSRYQLKLHKDAGAKLIEWADAVLFANYRVYATKEGKGVGSGERVVYTEERPAWLAKNRYGLPLEIPLDFDTIMNHIKGDVTK